MLIPPFFLVSVVALGGMHTATPMPGQPPIQQWRTEGSGFLYGYRVGTDQDGKGQYQLFIVTAGHVVKAHKGDMQVRMNPQTGQVKEFIIPSNPPSPGNTWFYHPNPDIDVAVVAINPEKLKQEDIDPGIFFANDNHTVSKKQIADEGIGPGDAVFVLGFPMNLAGDKRNYVIARQGIIARVAEMLDGSSTYFTIDANVYPGNSGGPVVLKPEVVSISGTKTHGKADLIGLVLSYKAYTEVAISQQTGQPRVVFQENSGLADVLPIDYVNETVEAWRATQPQAAPSPVPPPPPASSPSP